MERSAEPHVEISSIAAEDLFAGGGEMGALMRTVDWSAAGLGPPSTWAPALRTMVKILLANRFPMLLWWGPDFIQLYNDAYIPVLGTKHPNHGLARPASQCWNEIWEIIGPLIEKPFRGGPATWMDDILLEVNRHGFFEETHFTIAYSPAPDASAPRGIGGVLATVHEITEKVVGERRVILLRDLGATAVTASMSAEATCEAMARVLDTDAADVPFALIYLVSCDRTHATLQGASGVEPGAGIAPPTVDLSKPADDNGWPLAAVLQSNAPRAIDDLRARFEKVPAGPWFDPPRSAIVMPLASSDADRPAGFLVAGISARLAYNEQYAAFFDLVAGRIASAIAGARAYEEEKRRADALAEIDRAKTAFFSNVSHEFRTPLTLLLGPLEEVLRRRGGLEGATRRDLDIAYRNGLRLLKLVNTLLEFSRIEAGRVDAVYEPTDLSGLTSELASNFRSAIESAGVRFLVDTSDVREPVYVDRGMWEKIVLNLISNAFKHTFEGEIAVTLRESNGKVILQVRDTGVGIPAHELPHIFERFHRVPRARSRTHEGSGIGLALVQELVRLHGGDVVVESREDAGTTFAVSIPRGSAHLPAERIMAARARESTSVGAAAYVEEAMRWLPTSTEEMPATPNAVRIIVADDNADMRDYVARVLEEPGRHIVAVSDGAEALDVARTHPPDLVLTDVMMPVMDGMQLLHELRADPRTQNVPVVLLSARAGEEARVEALAQGATDYIVKPFAARELAARVASHVERFRGRRETEAANRTKTELIAAISHELRTPLAAISGYIDLIEGGIYGPVSEKQIDALDRVRQGGRHLLRLVSGILDFAKLEAGQVTYQIEDFALADAVNAMRPLIEPQMRERDLGFVVLVPSSLRVTADPQRVEQILLNLLSNAVKFSSSGKTVTLDARSRADGGVDVSVIDAGEGIDPSQLSRLFAPFVRLPQKGKERGTGLGLSISRAFARGMGGDLTVRSAVGKGSTFTLTLPRRPA